MSNEAEQIAQRQAKLDELVRLGVSPYPHRFDRIRDHLGDQGRPRRGRVTNSRPSTSFVRAAGRIVGMRAFGKANFLVLSDGLERLQVYVRADSMPELDFQIYRHLDLGDQIGVEGRLFRTKTNELTIWASRIHFTGQSNDFPCASGNPCMPRDKTGHDDAPGGKIVPTDEIRPPQFSAH